MTFWNFLTDPTNQDTLTWLGGGACVAIAALWGAYIKLRKKPSPPAAAPPPTTAAQGRDGITSAGTLNIGGDVRITKTTVPKTALGLGVIGLALLTYATFFAPSGDCIVAGFKAGGNVTADSIEINGTSSQVDC